jgi:hypothetical protein
MITFAIIGLFLSMPPSRFYLLGNEAACKRNASVVLFRFISAAAARIIGTAFAAKRFIAFMNTFSFISRPRFSGHAAAHAVRFDRHVHIVAA